MPYITRYRQHGIGNLLMDYIDNWFNERGLNKALLNVNLNNTIGIRFWEKRGFACETEYIEYQLELYQQAGD